MAYADPQTHSCKRLASLGGVALVHVALGFGLAAGLTVQVLQNDKPRHVDVFDVLQPLPSPPPPPPDDPPPERVEQRPVEPSYTPPFVPPAPIDIPRANRIPVPPTLPPVIDTPRLALPARDPAPPVPAQQFTPRGPVPANGPAGWITNADYPTRALVREWEGTASYAVDVGSDGRPDECRIISSTGHSVLDDTTCRLVRRQARFEPATDANGARVAGTYRGTVTWRIPED